jgi:N-acetyl-gamma-glutamyl-phosphate reductase
MGFRVSVAGASGYAGGELLRLLAAHPDIEIGAMAAGSHSGEPVGSVHPHLTSLADRLLVATAPSALADADVAVLALPHGQSTRLAAAVRASGTRVVDLGADHRLRTAAEWERFYGGPHENPAALGTWPYGLPELPGRRAALHGADAVAVPGCYPTATTLALAPLLAAGLVEAADLVVVALSGTSGAGRAAKASLLSSEVMGDATAYKVAAHQHTPEIRQSLGDAAGAPVGLSFTTVLAPMPRGILATCTATVRAGVTEADLRAALLAAYDGEPFVRVLPPGQWPHTAATLGSNACHLQVALDAEAARAVVVSAIDNLGKGAAGQAVQCLNLVLGLPETAGLTADGVAP